ncbi:MAG TPA: NAD-dependent epimerase/dehydratase family protein, partial [Naasia sp.]
MRLLLLGGTAWLGRTIARASLEQGHAVTCVARGTTGPFAPGIEVVLADRDRDDGLTGIASRSWDAVIDVSRQPGQVRRAVRDLAATAGRFVLVSTGNVYADHSRLGEDEDAPLLPPLADDVMPDMSRYGEAKVACEEAVQAAFGPERSLIARAGLIGGPGDESGRTGYWPHRVAAPSNPDGLVLVPDAPHQRVQVIDVRDLAEWLVRSAEVGTGGIFNATGNTHTLDEHLALVAGITGFAGRFVPAAPSWLREQGVAEWSGPRSLPLWIDDPEWRGFPARSNARALAAGLSL